MKKKIFSYCNKIWTKLVDETRSALSNENPPIYNALSIFVGVFIACTPFYGLQTLLILFVTKLFRLSFVVAFLGSQVSLPPFYSLLVPIQLYLGFKMLGKPLIFEGPWQEVAKSHFSAWLLGSIVVGLCLAFLLGGVWYVVQSAKRKSIEGSNS